MPEDVRLPELGENIEKAEVVRVLVSPGDDLEPDQPIVELETDKAALEVPSPLGGRIVEVLVRQGETIRVGQVLLRVEPGPEKKKETDLEEEKPGPEPPVKETPEGRPVGPRQGVPVAASPATRRFAREIGIEISAVPPGPGGRITIDEVKKYAKQLNEGRVVPEGRGKPGGPKLPEFETWGEVRREKMSSLRRAAAERLWLAWNQIPHVTQHDEADVTELEGVRREWNGREGNPKLTLTAFVLRVAAEALRRFPKFNASIDVDRGEIIYKKYIHIGVAVDTDRGLLVPVIRNADRKSIRELAAELADLAERARGRRLGVEEMRGGTFTITNLGGIGGTAFTPVVNWPEVAILGVSRARVEPVWRKGDWVARTRLPLSLSYDHRLIDGADAARFLRWIAGALEQPFLMMV